MKDDERAARLDQFYSLLDKEVREGNPFLNESQQSTLREYYGRLTGRPSRRCFCRYNWIRRVAPAAKALAALAGDRDSIRVLDAGCGCGTESILWGSHSTRIEVLAIDANAARVETARARLPYYRRQWSGQLSVRFVNDDVFGFLSPQRFDLIWLMESISHIDPAEAFLRRACGALKSGGVLAITDSNVLNPAMALKVLRIRLRGRRRTTLVTTSGARVQSAVERLFSPWQIRRRLKMLGLSVSNLQLQVFCPPFFLGAPYVSSLGVAWDGLIGRVPVLRGLGGVYTLVARKP